MQFCTRLLFTNNLVNYTCGRMGGVSDAIQKMLEKSKNDFWDRYERVKEAFESNCPLKIREEYSLENWYDWNIFPAIVIALFGNGNIDRRIWIARSINSEWGEYLEINIMWMVGIMLPSQ